MIKCQNYSPAALTRNACKYVQAKLDGHYTTVLVNKSGVRFHTSTPIDITDKLQFMLARYQWKLQLGDVILGELHVAFGGRASDVKTAINAQSPSLLFTGFAVGSLRDSATLETTREYVQSRGMAFAPFTRITGTPAEHMAAFSHDYTCEGVVYKHSNRTGWVKWKPTPTCELIVSAVVPARPGKFAGLIGSLTCSLNDGREVANVSGMTDAERAEITALGADVIGRVVEVEYQYVGSGGRLRHPRFVRFRDDRTQADCNPSQDESWQQ